MTQRKLSTIEEITQRVSRVMQFTAQGYRPTEIGRMLGVSRATVQADIERAKKRIPAEDAKQWRQVQLLRLERLMEACQAVLAANHVVVSNGQIVQQYVKDDEGRPIWDPVFGPDGEQLVDSKGNLRVEQRRVPLEDHAAVLEAVAEMRKIEVEIMKLIGTQVQVKQAVELQHVNYVIEGVDMDKVIGAVKTGTPE